MILVTLGRIRLRETAAHRAEFLLWILTLTMPLVMLVFWRAVAGDDGFRGYTAASLTSYFLAVTAVCLVTDCDAVWNVNEDIRTGTLSLWLLKPVHPFVNYASCTLAELPPRFGISLPLLVAVLVERSATPPGAARLVAVTASLIMGLAINQALQVLIGSVGFWAKRSLMLHRLYVVAGGVFSGSLFPLTFLPGSMQSVAGVLPFRFVIALPVELLTDRHPDAAVLPLLAGQGIACLLANGLAWLAWRGGVRRWEAYG